jgi:hypothetical protein
VSLKKRGYIRVMIAPKKRAYNFIVRLTKTTKTNALKKDHKKTPSKNFMAIIRGGNLADLTNDIGGRGSL